MQFLKPLFFGKPNLSLWQDAMAQLLTDPKDRNLSIQVTGIDSMLGLLYGMR